jgi:zinc protease
MAILSYPGPEDVHRHVLENGIVVLVFENFAAGSVVVEGVVRAGALAESREQAGLANMTADMLMRGTQQRSFDDIYEALESVGASLDISSGRHMTDFSGGGLVEDLDLILDLLNESLRYPTFPEEHLERVRGEIITGLQIRANDTRQMAGLKFRELLYGDHPYGQSLEGYLDSVPRIRRQELVDYHANYFGPGGMIITVVGAVAADKALAKIKEAFGDWQHPDQKALPAVPPAPRPLLTLREAVPMAEKTQTDIVMGLPGPLRSAADYLDAKMANTILGVFGMMGRLGKNVREKQGLAYYVHSRLSGGLGPSPWTVSTGVAPDMVEQAITSIKDEIERIQDELVPAEELADSQAYVTGSMPVSLETNDGLAGIISDIELYDLGLDYLQRYPGMINEITPERIQVAAQKYFSANQLAIVVAGPTDEG